MNRSFAQKLRLTLLAAGSMLMLVFGFQNCGKPGNMALLNSGSNGEVYKISTGQFRDLIMPDQANRRSLDLNIDSGTIRASDGKIYCLSSTDLRAIQELLGSANICEPAKRSNNPDVICTMIYKSPYAQLRSSSMELALGEARNGCDLGLDLCGDAALKLRVFISSVISGINGMQCN